MISVISPGPQQKVRLLLPTARYSTYSAACLLCRGILATLYFFGFPLTMVDLVDCSLAFYLVSLRRRKKCDKKEEKADMVPVSGQQHNPLSYHTSSLDREWIE